METKLANLGSKIAFTPNGSENLVIAAVGAPAFRSRICHGRFDRPPADALQNVGCAVDDGIKQVHQHRSPLTAGEQTRPSLLPTIMNGRGSS
jgi:hypothetical protein